jgi:DNA-binding NarL/FixJ family response regulator
VTAIALAQTLQADVVIMDMFMPRLNGLEATKALKHVKPDLKILILTRHADPNMLQPLLNAGARGCVLKRSPSEEIVRAIHRIVDGGIYLDPAFTEKALGSLLGRVPPGSRALAVGKLSAREEDVLRLVAWGLLSKEVAAQLKISIKTVETHKANALLKLGIKTRADIVRYALLQGWLQEP